MGFYILAQLINIATPSAKTDSFSVTTYAILSLLYIMIMYFAVNIGSEFNLIQMVFFFIFGGVLGYLFLGYETGFVVGVVLSLIFISSPRKDL